MGYLRPISLCNVVYKIITKMLANRMKSIFPGIISKNQSAFVAERFITDNFMIAFESVHFLKRRKQGKEGIAALKIDMSKAYELIEWKFLEDMMRKLGFCDKWVHRVMY